jgi:DNA-binding response OmpR family regulator
MRLLLLEDDPLLGEGLRDWLAADGHVVDWCRSLAETQAMAGEPFDALLVDWQLPDGSGLDWLKGRRGRGDLTPVLMLTAREWAVLEALVLRAGRIVPKAELEKLVLGFESELVSNALEVHASALRRKLGRELIETVRGLGYRVDRP